MGISENYMSRLGALLNDAIGVIGPDTMTRYMGGHTRLNQPFISGYHQIIVNPPTTLYGSSRASETQKWLTSACEGFTPHSSNINFVDVNGVGQIGASFPASRTFNREFTLTFREYQNMPILNIFRMWNGLFDPHLGITTMPSGGYIPNNYKGSICVGLLKPTTVNGNATGEIGPGDIEEVYFYEGVFPTMVPDDTATAADQATNDSIQLSVTFRFDGAPLDRSSNEVVDYFVSQVNGLGAYDETLASLGADMGS
jgi:hypothetical protein